MTSILEMPELVLDKIIGFSQFKAVLTLRQVCRDFRNFIDDLSDSKLPDSKFRRIEIYSEKDDKIIFVFVDSDNSYSRFAYSEMENSRSLYQKTTDLGSSNIVDVAIRDLELILKFQKSKLEDFSFNLNDFEVPNEVQLIHDLSAKLSNMFNISGQRIKTSQFNMGAYHPSHAIQILQLIDPQPLKIFSLESLNDQVEFDIDEIAKTEHWKKAEDICCDFHVSNLNLEDICHCSNLIIRIPSISAKELNFLRKAYIGEFQEVVV
ncbi:hypothetical protein B9Z55_021236 [Caenorhabditis nigoni]|uniref:F-box domain-containing protein n=1 Tax=Caenorhabditis nigoni TaxID=1611254 RepID=A0A2G5TR77_9PELO|nr:hypothetical protein B9Z55_021236 [Caenorhabditis nigoni]